MNRNSKIAAAIAAVIAAGSAGTASALPTLAQAQTPFAAFYISGSSAAKNGVLGAIENDFCGGASNALIFSSTGNTNFFAVSCAPPTGLVPAVNGANGTNVFTIYYRDEGGSVTGALPLFSGSPIMELNLSGASCAGNLCSVAVGGSSATNGVTDAFTGTTRQVSDLGVTDVEPGALSGDNYPTAYSPAVYGKASKSQLNGLGAIPVFQQVFGLFVNKTGLNTPICLGTQQVQAILGETLTDWSSVEDCATHAPVASGSVPITIVNREAGSGSRAATSIFWLNDECSSTGAGIVDDQNTDYFSTGNVLAAAATTNGAITYASIDNNGAQANLTMASINNVAPTNLAAAQGLYPFWVQSTLVTPSYSIGAEANSISAFFQADLANGNTAPHTAQINLIPGTSATNTAPSIPVSATANTCSNAACTTHGTQAIYVNPFAKTPTCNTPSSAL